MKKYILSIDAGTTGITLVLVDKKANIVQKEYLEINQYYPLPGWVEHDPNEILETTINVIKHAISELKIDAADICTAGIANHKPQLVGKPSDVQKMEIPEDDIIIEVGADIVWRASVDGFPDTQRGPEWVTEILNKVVGQEEDEVHEPEIQEVIN